MAEPVGDGSDVDAGGEEFGRDEVAQVVHAYVVEVEAFSVPGPSCGHEVRVPGPPTGRVVGEDLLVGSDGSPPVRFRACVVFAERLDGLCREGDEPDTARSWPGLRRCTSGPVDAMPSIG